MAFLHEGDDASIAGFKNIPEFLPKKNDARDPRKIKNNFYLMEAVTSAHLNFVSVLKSTCRSKKHTISFFL